jgi:phage gp46-like protein
MATDRQRLFGTDFALRDGAGGADFGLQGPVGASGDIALASGNTNIVQALTMRLRVEQGELALLGWPAFGSRLHELIGEPDLPRTRLKAQVFARDAVEADPRVLKVDAVDVVRLPGERQILRLALMVRVISLPAPLNLVFDLALDGLSAFVVGTEASP